MSVYGVDYLAGGDDLDFLIVEADTIEDARVKAGKLINAQGYPKRNIVNIELILEE